MKVKRTLADFNKFLSKLLHSRYNNKDDLEMILSNYFGFGVHLNLSYQEQNDYRLLTNFSLGKESKDLYLDLYYILDRQEQLYLTEYSLDGEHALSENDNRLVIVGVSR
jgi:hypothetical protein